MAKRGRSESIELNHRKDSHQRKKKPQKKMQQKGNHEKQHSRVASSDSKGRGNLGQGSRASGSKGKDSALKKKDWSGKEENKDNSGRRMYELVEDEDEWEEDEREEQEEEQVVEKPRGGVVVGESRRDNGGKSSKRRQRIAYEEEGYEGPVDEEDSESASQDDGESEDDSDEDSSDDDEIKLDGALMRKAENSEEEEEEDGEEEEQAEGGDQTVVSVSLDFCDPDERFFHGIRSLVAHTYLQDAAGSGLSPLVDLVVAQGAVGTVLSTEGEDDAVFGFVTALPLRYLARDNQCAQAVIKHLLDKAAKNGRGADMEAVLGEGAAAGEVGLLVSERMINCPIQAVPKLYEALVEDIAWAVKNEISEEHRNKFRFDNLVVVAPCDDTSGGRAARSGSWAALFSDFSFWRFDEEVLLQEAEFFFPMSCAGSSSRGGGSTSSAGAAAAGGGSGYQRYVVGVMPATKLEECAKEIAQMVE